MSFQPEFPGVVVVWIDNTNNYPIYDLSVFMVHYKQGGVWSKTAEAFNTPPKQTAVMLANESRSFVLPADLAFRSDRPLIAFDF